MLERSRHLVLGEILGRSARRSPEALALIVGEQRLTYAQLNERVNRLAHALAEIGVGRGDKVAILTRNRPEAIESAFAAQKLGACPVPLNFRLAPPEIAYLIAHSDAVGAIVGDQEQELISEVSGLKFTWIAGDENYAAMLRDAPGDEPEMLVREEDLAFIMYTSGTTGRPKGAMLSHRNLVANTVNWIHEIGARDDDVWLAGLPLFHIGAINGYLPFVYLGATSVIMESGRFDAAETCEVLERECVSICLFVPTQWLEICACVSPEMSGRLRLRKALWGASPSPQSTVEAMQQTFPDVEIVNAFGQTEMSSNTTFLMGSDAARKIGSIGKPVINVETRLVDARDCDVPAGEVGELVYRGPTVMQGYYKNDAATCEAFAGGWFHSGDLAYSDEDGFLYLVDRKKDVIISGGENIYPADLERTLREHPVVRDVAVVGVPHPKWVETPLAVVVPHDRATVAEAELIEHCKSRMASYKKPSGVEFVQELPRNAAGKVLKQDLRSRFVDRFAASATVGSASPQ